MMVCLQKAYPALDRALPRVLSEGKPGEDEERVEEVAATHLVPKS